MSKRRRWIIGSVLCMLLTAACAGPASPPRPPQDGISRARADQLALAQATGLSQSPVSVMSARVGRVREFEPGWAGPNASRNGWVWAISVSGTFLGSCGPPGNKPCPAPNRSALVLLDYLTGKWITTRTPASTE